MCGHGRKRLTLTGTLTYALNSALQGDNCTAVVSAPGASWDLILTRTLPVTRTLNQNLTKIQTLTLHLTRSVAWALTSALKGDRETRVPPALVTSLDYTLTLLMLSPHGDPTPKSDNTTRLGS